MSDKDDLISRQAAIDALHGYFDGMLETDTWSPCDVYGLIKILPSVQPEPHWIPCSKWMPEDGRYLVTRFDFVTNTCFLDILWYEKGVWWNRLYTGDFAVIAWMPLPEPYRGGDE